MYCSNSRERISLTNIDKYQCANSRLPVYRLIYMYDSEVCTFCNLKVNGDEYYYILLIDLPIFQMNKRTLHNTYVIPTYNTYYYRRPGIYYISYSNFLEDLVF